MRSEHYRIGFLDASIFLRRNMAAVQASLGDKATSNLVLKSIIQSIFKLARETLTCDRFILVHDKKRNGSYDKSKILIQDTGFSEYKSDRKELDKKTTNIYGETKYKLFQLNKFGIANIQVEGFESDDLVYLFSQLLINDTMKSVIISFDSDWNSWTSPKVDFYNLKHKRIYNYAKCCEINNIIPGCSLFETKVWRDSMRGSHNNLKCTLKPEFKHYKLKELLAMYASGRTDIFSDFQLFKTQVRTFNFEAYHNYNMVKPALLNAFTSTKIGKIDDFKKFRDSNQLGIPSWRYKEFLDNINTDDFDELPSCLRDTE